MTDELAKPTKDDAPRVRKADPSEFAPDPANANKGTVRGAYMVRESIDRHGGGRSIVVDRHGRTIAGAKTLEAAIDAGLDLVVLDTIGDALVVVRRQDMDLDDPDTGARSLAYADNRAGEVGLDWDLVQIRADAEAGEGNLDAWFFAEELDAKVDQADPDDDDDEDGPESKTAPRLDRIEVELGHELVVPFWTLVRRLGAATGRTPDQDFVDDLVRAGVLALSWMAVEQIADGKAAKVGEALARSAHDAAWRDAAKAIPGES